MKKGFTSFTKRNPDQTGKNDNPFLFQTLGIDMWGGFWPNTVNLQFVIKLKGTYFKNSKKNIISYLGSVGLVY